MSWKCVDQELPESEDDILAYTQEDGCYRAWFFDGTWLSHESNTTSTPTHWMTMPAVPQVGVSNGSGSDGMTDKLITSSTRPYSVWSDSVDTARDIKQAWEGRFGGPYKIFRNKAGFQVKYMGKWSETPSPQ